MAHQRTLRAQLTALLTMGDPAWASPPGSTVDRLRRGLPVRLSDHQIAACVAPGDLAALGVDLTRAETWVLIGASTLTPDED